MSQSSLPMMLTLARMGAGPVVAALVLWANANAHLDRPAAGALYAAAAALFALAALTDWLDGYLARKLNAVSALGAALDHAADKVLVTFALVALAYAALPAPLVAAAALILGRDMAVAGLREGLAAAGRSLPVSWAGKVKATVEMIAVTALLSQQAAALWNAADLWFYGLSWAAGALLWLAAALALLSGAQYAASALRPAPEPEHASD